MSFVATSNGIPAWVGTPPKDWRTDWLKWHVGLSARRPTEQETEALPYISNEDIESWTGKLLKVDPQPTEADGRIFCVDDVLFNKLRPYLAKVYHAEFNGISSGELLCLRSSERVLPRFLFYIVSSKAFIDVVDAETFGSKMPRADWEIVGHQPLPLPSVATQKRIVAFLDQKTAQIDALIAKKQALLERLAEKRQAIITQAVTRGLDPAAPMKDSGIDWLGQIPAHWEVWPLKRMVESAAYGISEALAPEGEVAILRMGNIQDGELILDDLRYVEDIDRSLLLRSGDVIFNRTNSLDLVGKAALYAGNYNSALSLASYLVRFRFDRRLDPAYAVHVMGVENLLRLARTYALPSIGQANLSPGRYSAIYFPLPPIEEQQQIRDYIKTRAAALRHSEALIDKSVELLSNYRSALITAAVTGQIEGLR